MNKLIDRAKKSKLNLVHEPVKKEKITSVSRQAYSQIRSFRLDDATWHNLTTLLEKINSFSQRKISASRLIKALIHLGKDEPNERLIKALQEVAI